MWELAGDYSEALEVEPIDRIRQKERREKKKKKEGTQGKRAEIFVVTAARCARWT